MNMLAKLMGLIAVVALIGWMVYSTGVPLAYLNLPSLLGVAMLTPAVMAWSVGFYPLFGALGRGLSCRPSANRSEHRRDLAVLAQAHVACWASGLLIWLIGLVSMLVNMTDPSQIGPGMALAILTTLYGAMLANMVCLPIADKLAQRSAEEALLKTIIIKGVMSIQSGDNPRVVEQKLKTFLPPALRMAAEQAG